SHPRGNRRPMTDLAAPATPRPRTLRLVRPVSQMAGELLAALNELAAPAECGMCFGDGKPGVTVTVAVTVADEHHVRRVLERQGWAVGIRQKLQSGERRAQRKDFCPEHKPAA
ncbi:MAG TPA: hypothetical protein VF933_13955, partial [Streptosporangiaceae bacterium]